MNAKEWLKATKKRKTYRADVLTKAGVKVRYMYQISCGYRSPSWGLAKRLEKFSNREMTAVELMKDVE